MTPAEKRTEIRWLLKHPVWTRPFTLNRYGIASDLGFQLDPPETGGKVVRLGGFFEVAHVMAVHVNPVTDAIDDNDDLNTTFRVWLEAGPWTDLTQDEFTPEPEDGWTDLNRWVSTHDIRLDCGGADLEEAMLEMARLVRLHYQDDGSDR